jgi:hypothetical protein
VRIAALAVAVLAVVALFWISGELHSSNCLAAGHTNCSVLPWDNGGSAASGLPGDNGGVLK